MTADDGVIRDSSAPESIQSTPYEINRSTSAAADKADNADDFAQHSAKHETVCAQNAVPVLRMTRQLCG
jgi:hypothetical protein